MNKKSFEKIFSVFHGIRLTDAEHASMRSNLVQYIRHYKTPSHFWLRRFGVAVFSFIILVSSGGILASASQSSLPGNFLYPIKRSTESIKKLTLNQSQDKVQYELVLLDKRFYEANTLLTEQKMTKESEQILAQAISQHTVDIKNQTDLLAKTNPADALTYNTKLTNILKTSSSILLAISDDQQQNTQALAVAPHTPTKLVLAAYKTADTITDDTKKLETIVLADTDIATIKTAEKKYVETHDLLIKNNIIGIIPPKTSEKSNDTVVNGDNSIEKTATNIVSTLSTEIIALEKQNEPVTENIPTSDTSLETIQKTNINKEIISETISDDAIIDKDSLIIIQDLANSLESAYQEKSYGKVIITADKIIQYFSNLEKIKSSEKQYNIKISEKTPISESDKSTESPTTTTETKNNVL